ncbi:MAG: YopX family protein [Hominimerdicola sp.]
MNEYLFRGKRKDNGKWVYGGVYCQKSDEVKEEAIYIIGGSLNYVGNAYEVIPETVGQYTGLTDKNGKKIFEGDIIKAEQWYNCGCYPHTEIRTFAVKIPDIYQIDIVSAEVIGNIHDNPELLKEGDGNGKEIYKIRP